MDFIFYFLFSEYLMFISIVDEVAVVCTNICRMFKLTEMILI